MVPKPRVRPWEGPDAPHTAGRADPLGPAASAWHKGGTRRHALKCLQATYASYDEGDFIQETNTAQNQAAYLVSGRADGHVYDEEGNKSILHQFIPGRSSRTAGSSGRRRGRRSTW